MKESMEKLNQLENEYLNFVSFTTQEMQQSSDEIMEIDVSIKTIDENIKQLRERLPKLLANKERREEELRSILIQRIQERKIALKVKGIVANPKSKMYLAARQEQKEKSQEILKCIGDIKKIKNEIVELKQSTEYEIREQEEQKEELLKQKKVKESNKTQLILKAEEKKEEFVVQYQKTIGEEIQRREEELKTIIEKGQKALEEKGIVVESLKVLKKLNDPKSIVYINTKRDVDQREKKIQTYLQKAREIKKEIGTYKSILDSFNNKYSESMVDLVNEDYLASMEGNFEKAKEESRNNESSEVQREETVQPQEVTMEPEEDLQASGDKTGQEIVEEKEPELNESQEQKKETEEFAERVVQSIIAEEQEKAQRKNDDEERIEKSNQVKILYSSKDDTFFITNVGLNKEHFIKREKIKPIPSSKLAEIMNEPEEKIEALRIKNPSEILHLQLLLSYDKRYGTDKARQYLNQEQQDTIDIQYDYLKDIDYLEEPEKSEKKDLKENIKGFGKTIKDWFIERIPILKKIKRLPFAKTIDEKTGKTKAQQQKEYTIELIEKDRKALQKEKMEQYKYDNSDGHLEANAMKAQEEIEAVKTVAVVDKNGNEIEV